MQRAGNRRSAHRYHVDFGGKFLQALFVLHPETLLFVNDDQAEILPDHIFRKQPVGAKRQIHLAFGEIFQSSLDFLRAAEPAEHFDSHGERLKPLLERFEVLEAKNGGRRKYSDLFTVAQGLESGAHYHFRLAITDIAAKQPVHRLRALHVAFDIGNGGLLVARLGKFERVFELALPVAVG